MKKIITIALLAALAAFIAAPAFAAADWDEFVGRMQQREKIRETGAAVLNDIRGLEPSGSELEIWGRLWSGDAKWRAAAALALIDRIFPNGDPSKWEEVSGFIANGSRRPRQLAAMDGLFVAVAALRELPDGVWASAALLDQFGKSAMGKVKFIDEIPRGMREVIDDVIAQTGLPGDWTSKKIRGAMPLLPVYRGYITRDIADSRQMQYLSGFGAIAGNGNYAWDRDRGCVYEVIDDSFDDRIFIP